MAKKDNNPAFVKRDTIVSGKEYARLLSDLKERFRRSQIKAAVKVNTEMLEFYWEMGRDTTVSATIWIRCAAGETRRHTVPLKFPMPNCVRQYISS